MLLVWAIFVCIIFLVHWLWKRRDIYKLGKSLNCGLVALPFVGHGYLFLGDNENRMKALEKFGRDALRKENGLSALWVGTDLYTWVTDPEAAELILKTCLEKDDVMKLATVFVGNGSIFAPVSIWRPRRKVLIPCFGSKNLKQFLSVFVRQSSILVEQIKKVTFKGDTSVWQFFTSYTMDTVAEVALSCQLNAQTNSDHPFLAAFDRALVYSAQRVLQPWLHSDMVFTNLPVYKSLMKDKAYLWDFVSQLIQSKRKEIKTNDDPKGCNKGASEEGLKTFLDLLIGASEGDDYCSNIQIVEEVMVILMAGNDTSAVSASFVTLMLSRHPEVQEKVYEELLEVFGHTDRQILPEDIPQLKYLDVVIRETLRLFPPVPIISRKVENKFKLPCGIELVPGTGVVINIWGIHRSPKYWGEDAEEFRPERFIDTPLKHPAAFMPFSFGSRNCIGYQFAMTSMKTVLSTLLRHYKILPATTTSGHSKHLTIRLKYDLMMKDVDNFQVQIVPRNVR